MEMSVTVLKIVLVVILGDYSIAPFLIDGN